MIAYEIRQFKDYLNQHDPENKELRRIFHENYEWLEGYFRSRWGRNNPSAPCGSSFSQKVTRGTTILF